MAGGLFILALATIAAGLLPWFILARHARQYRPDQIPDRNECYLANEVRAALHGDDFSPCHAASLTQGGSRPHV